MARRLGQPEQRFASKSTCDPNCDGREAAELIADCDASEHEDGASPTSEWYPDSSDGEHEDDGCHGERDEKKEDLESTVHVEGEAEEATNIRTTAEEEEPHDWSDVTFPCTYVPLQREEAEAMVRAHDVKYLPQNNERLTLAEINVLHSLEVRLGAAVDAAGGKAFVKLGMQSAKDVALFAGNRRTEKVLRNKLQRVDESDRNGQLVAFLESLNRALCVKSGAQALQLLISSHRIHREIDSVLESHRAGECTLAELLLTARDRKSLELRHRHMRDAMIGINPMEPVDRLVIAVRKYVPFEGAVEFRCFVRNKTLVAVSQYESGACYNELQEDSGGHALGRIISFFEHVQPRLLQQDCLLDVALLDSETYLVELGSWNETTSACLFDWEADAVELKSGPVSFRIRTAPLEDPLQAVPSRTWRRFIEEAAKEAASSRKRQLQGWSLAGVAALAGAAAIFWRAR